jgi:hypothetical protein
MSRKKLSIKEMSKVGCERVQIMYRIYYKINYPSGIGGLGRVRSGY